MNRKLFTKDFTLMALGQIISLFGNAAVRFALPLYLMNLTGSSALYGTVTACALIPAVLLSPAGGMIADRGNKRNMMVILDFFTAALICLFALRMREADPVLPLTVTLMLLYGIAGAYQPLVQASIPLLVKPDHFMAANSIINTISSAASLLGPVLGGVLYSAYGLQVVLWICVLCFLGSAVMELFIHIPLKKRDQNGGIWHTIKSDFTESLFFIRKQKPVLGKGLLAVLGINLFLSAMIVVGLPYMITVVWNPENADANRLYGFAEGALAAGGLTGGICAGVFANRLPVCKSGNLLIACALCAFPMGAAAAAFSSGMINYCIMTACCFLAMVFSTIFTVQMMSFVQAETPQEMLGKVIAVMLTVAMCAQPFGNALYGVLFEVCRNAEFMVILFAGAASLVIAESAKGIFAKIPPAEKACGRD